MSELENGLIQMNAHMIRQTRFDVIIALGVVAAICFVIIAVFTFNESKKVFAVWLVLAAVGVIVTIIAYNQPKVKEIKACANGPVSIEQIAALYDVVDVDGKMLTLRER